MQADWQILSLKDIFHVKHGFAFKGEFFTDEPQEAALVTPGNFAIGGGFQDGKRKYYKGPIPPEYVLSPGQVVVTMTDLSKQADTLGFAATIPDSLIVWLHNQRIGLLEFRQDRQSHHRFVEYLLRSREYRTWVVGSATGSTVKHTSPSRIEAFKCLIPPFATQKLIADYLGTLDDKIALNRRMAATLEEMARSIFKSWFVDFDPVRAKAEGRPTNLPPEIDALFPDTFTDSGIPEGWGKGSISAFSAIGGGSTPSTNVSAFWDGDQAWATPKDLSKLSGPVLLSTERKITEAGLKSISSGLYPAGTVLMSSRAPIGYLAISEIPVAVNQGLIALRPTVKNGSVFIIRWLEANMEAIHGRSNGSTFMEISKSAFRNIETTLPPKIIVESFGGVVTPLHHRLVSIAKESEQLSAIRDALLPKLIAGDLRVKNKKLDEVSGL